MTFSIYSCVALAATALLCFPHGLRAQDQLEFHSCTGQVGGGAGLARGGDSQDLDSRGYPFQAGGGFGVTPRLAIIADFMYQQFGVNQKGLETQQAPQPTAGTVRFDSVMLEPTYIAYATKRVNVYGLAGFGWLLRSVKFTNPGGTLTHPGGVMAPGGASADSGAFDLGAGFNYRLTQAGLRVFIESRYLHGLARNFDSILVPLTVGIRW